MMIISIITPCFNAEKYIADTVESVLTQSAVLSGRVELEYIICDGKSTDKTLEILGQVVEKFGRPPVMVLSEKDSGMYAALAKGLKTARGNFYGYINAGDLYSHHAFDIMLDIFESCNTNWITGLNCISNEKNQITRTYPPFRYRRRLIRSGFYGRSLPFIQQESTFWRAELNGQIDFKRLASLKYAGDYYLWHCFSKAAELKTAEAVLGFFKIHAGQLSENMAGYHAEVASIAEKPGPNDRLLAFYDRVMRNAPPRVKNLSGWSNSIFFDHSTQQWRDSER